MPVLRNKPQVKAFIADKLAYTDSDTDLVVGQIAAVEESLHGMSPDHSLYPSPARDARFRSGVQRLRLHASIIEQILTQPRPDDDAKMGLPTSGGIPKRGVDKDRQAFLIIGGPGCGKSTISRPLFESVNALIVDADDVKMKLPEYSGANAHLLHKESALVVEGANGVRECAIDEKLNFIQPRVGRDKAELLDDAMDLRTNGYAVHLILVKCDLREAARRVLRRMRKDGRYVSLKYACQDVGNLPERVYAQVRKDKCWESYSAYDASTRPVRCLERSDYAPHIDV